MDIGYFLKLMAEKGASDMFLTTGAPVNIKVEGKLYPLGNTGLPGGMVKKIAYSLMDEGQVPAFERDLELNIAIAVKEAGRFRVNVFKQRGEVGMVIRAIKSDIPTVDHLKLPQVLNDLISEPRGLILVVGATGSGKSTSLAAMIDYRNTNSSGHILTIEDPIEFLHKHKKSLVNQLRGWARYTQLSRGPEELRCAKLRTSSLIGEIRDQETDGSGDRLLGNRTSVPGDPALEQCRPDDRTHPELLPGIRAQEHPDEPVAEHGRQSCRSDWSSARTASAFQPSKS